MMQNNYTRRQIRLLNKVERRLSALLICQLGPKNMLNSEPKCKSMKYLKRLLEQHDNHPDVVVYPSSSGVRMSSSIAKGGSRFRNKRYLIHVTDFEAGGKKQIKNEEYFCGYMPDSEVPKKLLKDGDFMVRKVVKNEKETYMLSYNVKGQMRHREIIFNEGHLMYYMQQYCFDSISALVAFHCNKSVPVDETGGRIRHGVKRDDWQLYHAQIDKIKVLGQGAFGEVWLCSLQTGLFSSINVAVKVSASDESQKAEESEKLFMEAQTMLQLSHPHIVKLIGVAMYEQPLMIVLELCSGGSVLDALENKNPSVEQRHRFIVGAAKGMAYLEDHQIIHRDIAARNILIDAEGQPKISDFGLSIFGDKLHVKCLNKAPVRYLAPETLQRGHYSIKSDVFSYGVFVWEVWENGKQPWEEIGEDFKRLRHLVISGKRLANDGNLIPPFFWALCERCWRQEPDDRPTFADIVVDLREYDVEKAITKKANPLYAMWKKMLRSIKIE